MRLVFISKRRPQGRDLLERPYGRFYYLPFYLSQRENKVTLILLNYKNEIEQTVKKDRFEIHSINLVPNPVRAITKIFYICKECRPDWIIGFSDTYYGIIAYFISSRLKAKCLIDAYDNYESYIPWCKPLHWLWRYALKKCDAISCAGPSLKRLFESYGVRSIPEIIPMAVDPIGFGKIDRALCRQEFQIPIDKKVIGYFGAISNQRDIKLLLDAYEKILQLAPDILLVMAGRKNEKFDLPDSIKYLGYIKDPLIPKLINCYDCVVVINKDSSFGNYSYPIKLYEAMACEMPVVASRTESTAWILKDKEDLLIVPGSVENLIEGILKALETGSIQYAKLPDWKELAIRLEKILLNP